MTPKPTTVRLALPADEMGVFELLMMAHAENACAPLNQAKVADKIRHATHGGGGIIGVIEGPKRLEGVILMQLAQWWYADTWHLEELVNFVHPEHRQSQNAQELIQFGKWASEQMCMPIFMGILSGERTQAKIRLYRRKIKMAGATFVHNQSYGNLTEIDYDERV